MTCFQGHVFPDGEPVCPYCPPLDTWMAGASPQPPAVLPSALHARGTAPAGPKSPLPAAPAGGPAATPSRTAAAPSPPAPLPARQETIRLVVVEGMEAGRVFEVAKRAFIGTSPRIRVCLDDPSLKTIHAAVTVAGGRVEIVDAGGTGLLVNGNRVVRADLAPGDLVGIGRTVLRVERSAPGKGVEARRG